MNRASSKRLAFSSTFLGGVKPDSFKSASFKCTNAPSFVRFRASAAVSDKKKTKKVGWIGVGIMGMGMANNLAGADHEGLVVWNRSKDRCEELKEKLSTSSIDVASSPKEVVEECDTTFLMLSTPEAVRDVLEKKDGVLDGCNEGKAIVDCSTISVEDAKRNSSLVNDTGALFLEAPVSGSKVPAEQGKLIFLCAGNKKVYTDISSYLDVMGKQKYYYGEEVGTGTKMKLIVNAIMGTMLASLAEGITLAEKCGVEADQLVEVLSHGAMANPMFSLKGPKMSARVQDYAVNFPLEHAQKDIRLASLLADELGVGTPVTAAANECYKTAKGLGHSRSDFAAVIESLRLKS